MTRSRSRGRERLQEGGFVAPTYLQQESDRAGAPDSASRGLDDDSRSNWQRRWYREEESRGSRGYRDQPSA
jgi:hypothetical protein